MHGDCLALLPTLADKSVDAVICDPPYGTTACKWDSVIPFAPMWEQLKRVIKPRGAIVLFGSQPFTSALVMSNPKWFKYELIWNKGRGFQPLLANVQPMKAHENVLVFGLGGLTYNPQKQPCKPFKSNGWGSESQHILSNIRKLPTKTVDNKYPLSTIDAGWEHGLHPTQKPLALLEYLVKTYTNPGDMVLDFTFGSGTTGVACVNLDRDFIGIEKNAEYFTLGSNRINTALTTPRQQSILD